MVDLVIIKKGVPVASTKVICEKVGIEHRAVMQMVNKHENDFNEFGLITFEMLKPITGRPVKIAWINEDQSIFLITLLRNSKKSVKFKKRLTKEFSRMKAALNKIANQNHNAEWLEKRNSGKLTHRLKTDIIKQFINYSVAQGSNNAKMYYTNIAKMENTALFLLQEKYPNVRNVLNGHQLSVIQTADQIVAKALQEGMQGELSYKDIYKMAKKRVLSMAELVGKSIVPMFNQEQIDK